MFAMRHKNVNLLVLLNKSLFFKSNDIKANPQKYYYFAGKTLINNVICKHLVKRVAHYSCPKSSISRYVGVFQLSVASGRGSTVPAIRNNRYNGDVCALRPYNGCH